MNQYKIKATTAPQGARLLICADVQTLCAYLQRIKATAPKGATLASVLQSIMGV